ncbi:MAG: PQQ-like beta-propeller repeat protein [Gemmataceae bacterium]|nr:PQQ-like beta-propeller repeat protein [Gemmataceae bacterium]
MTSLVFRSTVALLLAALALAHARADDWPQWLGPRRDSVWREDGILTKFPPKGPKVLWRQPLAVGYTGPAVVGERLYVMDRVRPGDENGKVPVYKAGPGKERVLCLSVRDGKLLWKHEYDSPYVKVGYPSGPRATPLVDGERLYTLGTMGHLFCLDARSGKVHWSKNFVDDYKAPLPVWGWAAHPLIDGDRLICLVGGEKRAVMAFDKRTGKELWQALTTEEICYAPPILSEAGGRKQLIVWLSETVNGLDPQTGKGFWSVPHPADGMPERPAVNIATPLQAGPVLYVSSFYHGTLALKLAADRPAVEVLWRGKNGVPPKSNSLNTVMSTLVVRDGHLYSVCAFGELRCLDAKTGQRQWETYALFGGKKELFGTAFFVEQGDRSFIFTDLGDLVIGRLTPKGFQEIDRTKLIEPTQSTRGRTVVWCHPAFANRCVYVRNDREILCVSLAAP